MERFDLYRYGYISLLWKTRVLVITIHSLVSEGGDTYTFHRCKI